MVQWIDSVWLTILTVYFSLNLYIRSWSICIYYSTTFFFFLHSFMNHEVLGIIVCPKNIYKYHIKVNKICIWYLRAQFFYLISAINVNLLHDNYELWYWIFIHMLNLWSQLWYHQSFFFIECYNIFIHTILLLIDILSK